MQSSRVRQKPAVSAFHRPHLERIATDQGYLLSRGRPRGRCDCTVDLRGKQPDRTTKERRDVQFQFQLVPDCGAIPSISIFIAAVVAFPTLVRHRVIGVFAGTALLYAINVSRLSTLAYIGAIDDSPGSKWFNFIHEYVWQGIFIVFVVAVWMAWIELVVRVRRS